MDFTKEVILTAISQRRDNNDNTVTDITVLDMDGGETSKCVYKGTAPLDFSSLPKMTKVVVDFSLFQGKWTALYIKGIIPCLKK